MPKLDLKDRKILSLLDMNARTPLGEIAKKAGVSRQVAGYRIERMKKDGIILGAITIFDSVVAGFNWFRVIIRLRNASQKKEILTFLANHPNACWVGEVGGTWDIVVNFITKDNYSFNNIFEDFLSRYGKFISAYETLVYINIRDQSRTYLIESNKLDFHYCEFNHEMKFNSNIKLDDIAKKIIKLISRDAFMSNWQVAAKIGVSDKTVSARIREMEKNKLILGYRLLIHPSAMGYESYMLFLSINNLQKDREKELQNFINANPNITYIVKHFGKWRIGLEVEVKNRIEFQNILVSLRDKFGDIISDFETFPIFRDYVVNYFPDGNL